MSTSSNISQSTYSPSEPETPQSTNPIKIQNFDQSLNHAELGLSIEQSLKNAQKEMHQKRIQTLRKELDYLKSTEWEFEHDKGFIYHLFKKDVEKKDDFDKEEWVAEKLIEFEFEELRKEPLYNAPDTPIISRNSTCFHRTGVITLVEYPTLIIDGHLFYDMSSCTLTLNINDKVTYLGYKNEVDNIVITRILENHGMIWETWDENRVEESRYEVIDHVIVAEVESRQKRLVFLKDNDLKFNLDDVEGTMVPIVGDWLELKCSVQLDEEKPYNISGSQVLKVTSYKPLRTKIKSVVITQWNGTEGTCDHQIYFNKESLSCIALQVGQTVLVEAIESDQGQCTWRALKLVPTDKRVATNIVEAKTPAFNLDLEREKGLEITYPIKFDKVDFKKTAALTVRITNRSNQVHIFNKWLIPSRMRDSQINVHPILARPYKLYPDQTYSLNITCKPKFLGSTKENLILLFKGLKVERTIEIHVVNHDWLDDNKNGTSDYYQPRNHDVILSKIRQNDNDIVPGPKITRTPHFVAGRIGIFPIPDIVWAAILGDSSQGVRYGTDLNRVLSQIVDKIPCLAQDLNIYNYADRWHSLLFMEEIQENIDIRIFDKPKTFLIKLEEFLAIEVSGLSEKRPSLVTGDKAIVKDIWDNRPSSYEGYIHAVRGNLVLMKFHRQFQESYSGSDVSIEFHFSRTSYRKSHQAINRAITNLGPEILFPSKLLSRDCQLPPEKLESIEWYDKQLNDYQKAAVSNILLGQCRPKPYLIYGPPGTGKTVTVIETILQILKHFPDSRILVATPSNSAANLITERLIEYKKLISNSFMRVVAHHLVESDKIPPHIKPYCATLGIAREGTSKPTQGFQNGIRIACQASYIGRQRVTIGTCCNLATLSIMAFPKGHFTHIMVDEAGQCTEPDIMNVLTFTDKENGQIILAGDPMQLGPVIFSRYAQELGLSESYFCRLLETFPYQKDFAAFKNGFNDKLVTKLHENYRSLEGVITLPSQMFYDGSLIPKVDPKQKWISNIVQVMNKIFHLENSETGGIYVNGIRGQNTRALDSPSWFNRHEASMVAMTTCELYKGKISVDDIGIITPYVAQIKYLQLVFQSLGLPEPKIGTVEEFQGQERPIIIISTVRTSTAALDEDIKHQLGFIKNPKRLNVAVTRARVAVLLVCDPHLLCKDPLWFRIINQAVNEDKYMGCDLPSVFVQKR